MLKYIERKYQPQWFEMAYLHPYGTVVAVMCPYAHIVSLKRLYRCSNYLSFSLPMILTEESTILLERHPWCWQFPNVATVRKCSE